MKLMIYTQYHEYYGTPEHGRWKPKGGMEYFIPLGPFVNTEGIKALAAAAAEKLNYYSEFGSEEYVVDWSVEEDDYLTGFEKDQLEYEGVIRYPARQITL